MNFRSYNDLVRDVKAWAATLPEFDAVVGVPRSGTLVASLLAVERGWDLGFTIGRTKHFLLVDDSVSTSNTMRAFREWKLPAVVGFPQHGITRDESYETAALYAAPGSEGMVQHHYATVPHPRAFEWNLRRWFGLPYSIVDLDGVICHDPDALEDDTPEWVERWIVNATPKWRFGNVIGTICTSRLERYRPQTEAWLKRHGIRYARLIMGPWATAAERRVNRRNAAHYKATAYMADGAMLFIESSEAQAKVINELTKRPVLCTDTMTLHGGANQ